MVDGFVSVTTSLGKLATDLTAKRNSCTGIFLVNLMVVWTGLSITALVV